jgi:hypothetical protein
MTASQERPGPPACTAWSAKERSNDRSGAPRRPKDSKDIGTNGRAEDTCRYARRLGFPGSGRKLGDALRAYSKGRSRLMDDGNVSNRELAREHKHDVSPGPMSKGGGDT